MMMEIVMAFARGLGNESEDASSEYRGYDIESRDGRTGCLRFMEVKDRHADAQSITVTRNEIMATLDSDDAFILAMVLVEKDDPLEPLYVTDPARLFGAKPGFNEVHRAITVASIRAAAQTE